MSFPQSGHRMSSLSVRKPRPTSDSEHFLQLKQSLCHCRSSKEMYLVPPRPAEAGGRPGEDGEGAARPGSRTVDSELLTTSRAWAPRLNQIPCSGWGAPGPQKKYNGLQHYVAITHHETPAVCVYSSYCASGN